MNIFEAVLILLLLVAVSAFVSCSELALASSRKIKLQVLGKEGDTRALDVLNMQEQPGSFITVVQIGLNAVAILAGIVGEAAVRPYLGALLQHLGDAAWAGTLASLLSFFLVTGLFILFADLMPKRFAMTHPERVAVRVVRPMMLMIFLLKPLVWFFDGIANLIFKTLRISTVRQDQLTSEDIYAVVDAGAEAGVLKQQEHYLIENIFDMQSRTVTSTMTTRENIAYFDKSDSADTVLALMAEKPHAKFLVCNGELEKVIGYIESHTLLTLYLKEQNLKLTDKRVLHKALFIPDTLSLYEVLEAFKNGEDVHRRTADEVFGIAPENVGSEQRRYAKTINCGLIYGMGQYGLAKSLGIDALSAKSFIDRYFARYPGVADYMQRTKELAAAQGYVETVLGRRLYLPGIHSKNGNERAGAERAAINAPMQGTAADLIKKAMVAVQNRLDAAQPEVLLIMQVHDELVFELPAEKADWLSQEGPALMAGVARLKVPLLAEVGVGANWEQAH